MLRVLSNGGRMTPTRRVRQGGTSVPRAAFLLAISLLAGACATPAGGPGGSSTALTGSHSQAPEDLAHKRAHEALERWADAVRTSGGASITFVGDLTGQIGEGEPSVGANNKPALLAGLVESPRELSSDRPPRDKVKWLDGSTVDVDVLSAAATLDALIAAGAGECAGCEPLEVTDAQLATGIVQTSRGAANAPIWAFSIAGSAVKVTRLAGDSSVTVDPPPWNSADPLDVLRIESATGTPDSNKLTVLFIGARSGADKPCGVDYTTEAVESDLAVVVIVYRHPYSGTVGKNQACALGGFLRTAKVNLADALGKRTVLEAQQGLPVPVTAP